ncbi:MAG: MFS transporter [Solirubrobacterales bacterium]
MATPETTAEGGGLSARSWKVSVFVLAMASLVTAIDLTIISVALPTVEADLGLSPTEGQWVVNAYLIAFTVLLIPGGMFGDRIGQLKGMNVGLVVFGLGSLMCGLADDATTIIVGRAIQGLGAAILMPCIQALVTRVAPEGKTGTAFGVYAAVSAIGLAIGPLAGGAIVDLVAWEWIFLINPIIIAPLLFLNHVFLRSAGQGIDRNRKRLISAEMLKRPSLRSGLFLIFWIRMPLIWAFIYTGIYFQSVLGYSPLQAGLAMIPGIIGIAIGGLVSGRLKDKVGWRPPTIAGFILVAVCLGAIGLALTLESYVLIVVPMFVLGIAVNFATTPVNVHAIADADPVQRGMISGTMTVAAQAGNTVGSLVLGGITNALILGSLSAEYAADKAETIYQQIQHPADTSDLSAGELTEGLKVFSESMSEAALIGAGIVLLALAAAWAMRMFKDPGPSGDGGLDIEQPGEGEAAVQT